MYEKNLTPIQWLLVRGAEWWHGKSLTEKEINDIILGTNIAGITINAFIEIYKEIKKHDNYNISKQLPYH